MEVTLSHDPQDIPVLGELNRLAYTPELASRFAFRNWPDVDNARQFYRARVTERMAHPASKVFKAVDIATGEILGFVALTLEEAEDGHEGFGDVVKAMENPTMKAVQMLPEFLNQEFILTSGAMIKGLQDRMKGGRHYYISTLVVSPQYQRKGIGAQLMRKCLEEANKEGLPTWLISFPGSHELYLKLGFVDVEHSDVDLNEWDGGRCRGYGIYRSYAMRRGIGGENE
ncbi:acyl-CoA N-acyltransferase [Amylocarpus encephaloides]|uniref:Acyl-CoA N-acyltransferase n=1 Tax=Amylocarpus encephaloides TaxID=45428 RepID=A0A9P8C8J4_9HELO|nr:acyl-CoA N-acyltransferase [Amylocarpus encephaloides]